MSTQDGKDFMMTIDRVGTEISSSAENASSFLQEVGIIDAHGDLTEAYENLCIPNDQD